MTTAKKLPEPQIVHHYHTNTGKGSVTIKLERNSRGLNWEIRIDKPIDAENTAKETGWDILDDMGAIEAEIEQFAASKGVTKPGDKAVIDTELPKALDGQQ